MSSPSTAVPELVTLKDGLSVSLAALRVLWNLEERGLDLRAEGDVLLIRPRSRLTAADDAAIRSYRDELLTLVRTCEVM